MASLEQAWAVVRARPDDLDARQVLADAMLETGDVHGELIELQLAKNRAGERLEDVRAREEELLTTSEGELLGERGAQLHLALEWVAGFVRTVTTSSLESLQRLLHAPAGQLIAAVVVKELTSSLAPLAGVLAGAPPTLKKLEVKRSPSAVMPPADVSVLLSALPQLERLHIDGLADFSTAESNTLRVLEAGSFINTEPTFTTLGTARLPALRTLQVVLSDASPRFPGALLNASGFAAVEALQLFGYIAPAHLAGLASSPLLARLKTLRLVPLADTGWAAELTHLAERLRHLERLEVSTTLDRFSALGTLEQRLPNLVLDPTSFVR